MAAVGIPKAGGCNKKEEKEIRRMKKRKKGGFIVSAELVLIATIMVLGLLIGMVAVRDTLIGELVDCGQAFGSLNQSHEYPGVRYKAFNGQRKYAFSAGSDFDDKVDRGDGAVIDVSIDYDAEDETFNGNG
jgi:hypothetical protein